MSVLKGTRRKEMIRPFLAHVLGINNRQIGRLFGVGGRIQPDKVRAYLEYNGYRRPIVPRQEQVRDGKVTVWPNLA